jgi:hypothetical protein
MHRIVALSLAISATTAAAEPLANLGAMKPPTIKADDAADSPTTLTEFRSADFQFRISVPVKPKESTFDVKTPSGTVKAHRWDGAAGPSLAYAIAVVDVGDPTKLDVPALLDATMATAAKTVGGTSDYIDKNDALASRSAMFKTDNHALLDVRFFLAGHFLFGLEVGDTRRRDALGIVESFHFGSGTVEAGGLNTTGDLDKAIIRRYIKRNLDKIQYCYGKKLVDKPKLAGTLAVTFTINTKGQVENAKATGLDPDVASCVAAVISEIEFPKPKTGTVDVSYPFVFRPTS